MSDQPPMFQPDPRWSQQPAVQPQYPAPYQPLPRPNLPQPMQPYPPQQPYAQPQYPPQYHYPQHPYQQPYGPPQQQMYMPPQQPVIVNVSNQQMQYAPVYMQRKQGPGCVVSTLYFLFIGSWLGLCWLSIALLLCCTIILIPVGMQMIKQLPMAFLLQPVN